MVKDLAAAITHENEVITSLHIASFVLEIFSKCSKLYSKVWPIVQLRQNDMAVMPSSVMCFHGGKIVVKLVAKHLWIL